MVFERKTNAGGNNGVMRVKKPEISIVFPVYNERTSIERVLKEWKTVLDKQDIQYQFVVCEDGSTDGTSEFLRRIQKKYSFLLNQKTYRRGYGRAVINGIKAAEAPYILCVDSDGQCDPKDFSVFWRNRTDADILIGWRMQRADVLQRKVFSLMFYKVFHILFPINIHDPSAPYVLFKKSTIFPMLKYLSFLQEGFWWGFIGMCVKKHLYVREYPIRHRKRFSGDTQVYHMKKIPSIAVRNIFGLVRLRMAK